MQNTLKQKILLIEKQSREQDRTVAQLARHYKHYAHHMQTVKLTPSIELKDILLPLCDSGQAFIFQLDARNHFWQKVSKTKQYLFS